MNPNPFAWPFRAQYLSGFLICALLLAYAFYEQFQMGVEPCPMCIFSAPRLHQHGDFLPDSPGCIRRGPQGRRVYASLVGIMALIGIGVALNHLRMQFTPRDPMMGGCGPGLAYMLDAFPLNEALKQSVHRIGRLRRNQLDVPRHHHAGVVPDLVRDSRRGRDLGPDFAGRRPALRVTTPTLMPSYSPGWRGMMECLSQCSIDDGDP